MATKKKLNFEAQEEPEGFQFAYIDSTLERILLPTSVVHELADLRERKAKALELAKAAAEDSLADAPEIEPEACSEAAPTAQVSDPEPLGTPVNGRSHRVFNAKEVLDKLNDQHRRTKDSDERFRLKHIIEELQKRGSVRAVAWPERLKSVEELVRSHPNFAEAINLAVRALRLADRCCRPPQIPPMLLVGPPGTGKTHFAQALAEALAAPLGMLHFDTGVQNSALLGLAKHWGNTHHGTLFDQICLGQFANPVIVVDEMDKAERYIRGDALNAFHSVLEPVTAVAVTDVSLDVTFDASLVTYIATANRLDRIAESLRSRFRVIHVPAPDARQAIAIAESVFATTLPKVCPPGFAAPDRRLVVAVAHVTARELRQALEAAVACAVESGRSYLTLRDFEGLLDTGADDTTASWLH